MSFNNVSTYGQFRWPYDALYHDEDGTLSGEPNSVIMAPDGMNNVSSSVCEALDNFENAIRCPLSNGSWLRFSFRDLWQRNEGQLQVSDENNASTIIPFLQEQLTYPNGYLVVLRVNQTYTLQFPSIQVSLLFLSILCISFFLFYRQQYTEQLKYTGVIYDVSPGDYLIIQHPMRFQPARASIVVNRSKIAPSEEPLSGTNNINGDWFYDTNTSVISYIGRLKY